MLSEDTIEMQKDLYLCFINYKKTFNKVQNKEVLREILEKLDPSESNMQIIGSLLLINLSANWQ